MIRCEMCQHPTRHGDKVHPLCQAKAELAQARTEFASAHRLLCCVLATRDGYAKVTDEDLQRATRANFKINVKEFPGRVVELRLDEGIILPAGAFIPKAS